MKVLILIACLLAFTMSFRLTAKTRQEDGHCPEACGYAIDLLAQAWVPADIEDCLEDCGKEEYGPDGEPVSLEELYANFGDGDGIEALEEFAAQGCDGPKPSV